MTAAELDEDVTQALKQLAVASDLGLSLGAGASLAAGLPGLDQLAVELLTQSGAIEDRDTTERFLTGQDPALAAEAARSAADDWPSLLRSALYGPALEEPEPTPLHNAVARLAIERGKNTLGPTGLYTLIERAYEQLDPSSETFARGTSSPRASPGQVEVHHLHGALPVDGEGVSGVVLTLSDFTELSSKASPWQVAVLQEQLQRGPLILVGTSCRDEFAKVKTALVEQWEVIGVNVLVTHDHADAAQSLHELLWIALNSGAQYVSPRTRARKSWATHAQNFLALQAEHSKQLAADVQRLKPELGAQASLTLWLSDGEGRIVRWASNDRLYQDVNLLVRVPAGFDSDWVVGQCLSSDETLALPLLRHPPEGGARSSPAPSRFKLPGDRPFPLLP